MTKTLRNYLLLLLCWRIVSFSFASRTDANARAQQDPVTLDKVLTWLPTDTETVIVANGPFLLKDFGLDEKGKQESSSSPQSLKNLFRALPLGLFSLKKSNLEKHLDGQEVLLGVEGSRHFRPPAGLGEYLYQGCEIAIFANDISDRGTSFMNDASKTALRIEEIDGQKIAVFQDQMENDLWTSFVAFPTKNIVVVSTDKAYLRDVLARIRGIAGPRALLDSLREWKYVNKRSEFWGLRHFDKSPALEDLTSPLNRRPATNLSDRQAIGITFTYDPKKSRSATITYLSNNTNLLQLVTQHLVPEGLLPETGPGFKTQYKTVEQGVVQGSFELANLDLGDLYLLVLMAHLGHVVNF